MRFIEVEGKKAINLAKIAAISKNDNPDSGNYNVTFSCDAWNAYIKNFKSEEERDRFYESVVTKY